MYHNVFMTKMQPLSEEIFYRSSCIFNGQICVSLDLLLNNYSFMNVFNMKYLFSSDLYSTDLDTNY